MHVHTHVYSYKYTNTTWWSMYRYSFVHVFLAVYLGLDYLFGGSYMEKSFSSFLSNSSYKSMAQLDFCNYFGMTIVTVQVLFSQPYHWDSMGTSLCHIQKTKSQRRHLAFHNLSTPASMQIPESQM